MYGPYFIVDGKIVRVELEGEIVVDKDSDRVERLSRPDSYL